MTRAWPSLQGFPGPAGEHWKRCKHAPAALVAEGLIGLSELVPAAPEGSIIMGHLKRIAIGLDQAHDAAGFDAVFAAPVLTCSAGELVATLRAEGIADPIDERIMLAAVLDDLFRLAGTSAAREIAAADETVLTRLLALNLESSPTGSILMNEDTQ